jgi:hypothetical protein
LTPQQAVEKKFLALPTSPLSREPHLKVTPHVAAKDRHSAVDGRVRRHAAYRQSLKVRKRIEEAFGWIKTVGGLAKTKLIGRPKLAGQALLCFAAYNLVRIGSLCGWWDPHHA